ncbi:thiamine phosphate synthase [uncultured Oscillibacter sp.]|uniref:thiamine phosphate synthase n=1 Tax=uncultured Oscillibacter sp. TaxID=876091 RepID=UPI0026042B17|nr:thiamine phosphate synthase [uncultured Oscillibacter sp.]
MGISPETFRLYAVTDRAWAADEEDFFHQIEAAVRGGAAIVQLREKRLEDDAFLAEARRFAALCRELGAVSIINDRPDIALAAGADGVHVGQDDLAAGRARALLGPGKLLGVSAHSRTEALRARAAGADYLGVGAAFATGTKADARPISRETIRAITAAVDIPAVAIGGVSRENILELRGLGLAGVAVVSGIFGQKHPEAAARELRALVEQLYSE